MAVSDAAWRRIAPVLDSGASLLVDCRVAKTREALDTIVRMLSPYLGETMARAAAHAHCQKLGIVVDSAEMTREQLDALLRKFAQGLNIFLGREKAALVVGEIQAAMAGADIASALPSPSVGRDRVGGR